VLDSVVGRGFRRVLSHLAEFIRYVIGQCTALARYICRISATLIHHFYTLYLRFVQIGRHVTRRGRLTTSHPTPSLYPTPSLHQLHALQHDIAGPIRQYATQRYNQLLNRAVVDEVQKLPYFLLSRNAHIVNVRFGSTLRKDTISFLIALLSTRYKSHHTFCYPKVPSLSASDSAIRYAKIQSAYQPCLSTRSQSAS
jgi:hypothetical protein